MKKALSILISAALLVTITACSGSDSAPESPAPIQSTPALMESAPAPETSAPASPTPEEAIVQEAASETPQLPEESASQGSNVLVVYFSRVGVTPFDAGVDAVSSASTNIRDGELVGNMQYLAEYIVTETGGDLFQIITEKEYPTDYRDTTDLASEEQGADERPALVTHVDNMEQYDVIFLGYPNWWGTLPQAVMSFLEEYDFSGKIIAPFCSHGGSRLGRGPDDIQALCPNAQILDGLAVNGSHVSDAHEDVASWIRDLELPAA